ncbi:hypothetical protein [Cellulosimicrobium sp. CUA-896]|uniref:hypothetical protein n=1 Tax=Cellulosimicrobium sp. CUA-896 TaxID=1517881 RepID=UPI000968A07C|nr:hypothetical protein [Cellulosimicrobium sp. CUA-896]OLT55432.1 hypothetical protein BJF88_06225 [Cellulosimicrobium sp. CUA-896]
MLADGSASPATLFGLDATETGAAAWAGLALLHVSQRADDEALLATAVEIASWIVARTSGTGAVGGFTIGTDADGAARTETSTAQNIDCAGFFGALHAVTGDSRWAAAREVALNHVRRAYAPDTQSFRAGSTDGSGLGLGVLSVGASARGLLVEPELFRPAVESALLMYRRNTQALTEDRPTALAAAQLRSAFAGPDLSATVSANGVPVYSPGAWTGETAQLCLAVGRGTPPGSSARPDRFLRVLESAQADGARTQHVAGRRVHAEQGLVAGWPGQDDVADLQLFQFAHVGATAWFLLASTGTDPYDISTAASSRS